MSASITSMTSAAPSNVAFGELLSLCGACGIAQVHCSETFLGRAATCEVQVENPYVSGQHARVLLNSTDGSVSLEDLSTNGCFVNGKRVGHHKTVSLRSGDQISLTPPPRAAIEAKTDFVAFMWRDLREKATETIVAETSEYGVSQTYSVVKVLGSGTFGKVYLAVNVLEHSRCALKTVDKHRFAMLTSAAPTSTLTATDDSTEETGSQSTGGGVESLAGVLEEVRVLNKLRHPHIISVFDVCETPRYVLIALQLATGGDLEELLRSRGRLLESDCRGLIVQIFNALEYLHSENVVHRDLKPANILIHEAVDGTSMPRLLLTDFGLSKILDTRGARCTTICGTPLYTAPEVIQSSRVTASPIPGKVSHVVGYDASVDMWAAGVILYEMVCGCLPFTGENVAMHILELAARRRRLVPPKNVELSSELQGLLGVLMNKEKDRITAKQALNHPWMKQGRKHIAQGSSNKRRNSELSRIETVLVGAPKALHNKNTPVGTGPNSKRHRGVNAASNTVNGSIQGSIAGANNGYINPAHSSTNPNPGGTNSNSNGSIVNNSQSNGDVSVNSKRQCSGEGALTPPIGASVESIPATLRLTRSQSRRQTQE